MSEATTKTLSKEEWIQKAQAILDKLTTILEELETNPENRDYFIQMNLLLKDLSSSIGPKTIIELDRFCRLQRIITKYALRIHDAAILNISVAIIYDAQDIMKKMVNNIKEDTTPFIRTTAFDVFATRVRWLKGKIQSIESQLSKTTDIDIDTDLKISLNSIESILSEFNA